MSPRSADIGRRLRRYRPTVHFVALIAAASLTTTTRACEDAAPENVRPIAQLPGDSGCGELLAAIRRLDKNDSWTHCANRREAPAESNATASTRPGIPPAPREPATDPALCRLLDPTRSGIDSCLVAAIADTRSVPEVRCPSNSDRLAIGDLAFFVLSARHPRLWRESLPGDIAVNALQFQSWIESGDHRSELQDRVANVLAAPAATTGD